MMLGRAREIFHVVHGLTPLLEIGVRAKGPVDNP
jgi:hypothetical protein